MSRLDRIRVAGYRSIKDQTVELRPLNLLIGANGSGKSNFLGTFRLLHELVQQRLQVFVAKAGGADQILHFGRKVTNRLELRLWFDQVLYLCDLVPAESDSLLFEREVVKRINGLGGEVRESGQEETALSGPSFHPVLAEARAMIDMAQSWRVYHFNDTSSAAPIKTTSDLHDNRFIRTDGRNLAAFLYWLQEKSPDVFRNLTDVVRIVAPFFDSFQLQPSRLNPDKIRFEWRERASDEFRDSSSLSDGTLRFICIAALLLQPDLPSTILLDEPELGLHPYAVHILADLLRSAAARTQVIVATQSVTLVNQFGPEDILVVDRIDGASVFRRLRQEEIDTWLDDYSLGELWEKNVLGGRPGA
jgi:predicted ATPase